MAFNPFSGFAKYKRLWMGAVMILVMITFVLCTGSRGGFDEVLLRVFRFGGIQVASIDGTTYYRQDFDVLVKQRKVANDYMRIYSKTIIDMCNERLRGLGESKDDNAKQMIMQLSQVRTLLTFRTKNPKFFDTGTKADELIDFRVWLAEADRLNIQILPQALEQLIDEELHKHKAIDREQLLRVENKVLAEVMRNHGHEIVNVEFVRRALENEFRVRIAQLADAEYQFHTYERRAPKRINPSMTPDAEIYAQLVRLPMSPGQLWDFYQENRREFDVALLPIPVADFTKDIADPDPKKLEDLFEKFKKAQYDPASDQPGFRKPQQIRVQYVSADPNSPFFKRISRTTELMTEYPIGSFVPQMPLATVLTFAAGPTMFDSLLERDYLLKATTELATRLDTVAGANFALDPGQAVAAYYARRNPFALASMIGAASRMDEPFWAIPSLLAIPVLEKTDMLAIARKDAARALAPLFATVAASGTMPGGFTAYAQLEFLSRYNERSVALSRSLPLAIVRPDILKGYDERVGRRYVLANMAFFKKKLEEENIAGKPAQVMRELERYGPRKAGAPAAEGNFRDLGLEIAQTEKYYDRYTIKNAPELKPLLEAYERYHRNVNLIEGRDRPEIMLKDDEFWKLFFDPSESFSISGGKYNARPWPPVVKLGTTTQIDTLARADLDMPPAAMDELIRTAQNREPNKDAMFSLFATSSRPFLFWKTDEKVSEIPEALADVKDRVLEAWKLQQARETKVLPFAKKLAENLLAGHADYASVLKLEGAKINQSVVSFERLAPMYFDRQPFGRNGAYSKFKLKRDAVSFPRDDMVSQLLALNDLKEPIKTEVPDLDKLNADLFADATAKKMLGDKFVQVLTNKPRDTFYIAVVASTAGKADSNDFFTVVLRGAATGQDMFFLRAQERLGAEHFRAVVQQLRKNHRVEVFEGAKSYDEAGGGQ